MRATLAVLIATTLEPAPAAQPLRPKAVLTPLVETDGVHAGTTVRLALRVALPEGIHVQSDKPRDPALIATALTFTTTPGIAVTTVTYPAPTDFHQAGQSKPLAVFERQFTINVQVKLAPDVPTGDLKLAASLRYQACDAHTCFIPAREPAEWQLEVVPKVKAR